MLTNLSRLSGVMAGFECATQMRRDGRRHDFVAATRHDVLAERDYALLRQAGIGAARDGLRWHLIEQSPGRYDWSSLRSQQDAAAHWGVIVVWDLLHYGWPDWIDPLGEDFAARFADFAAAAARQLGPGGCYTPINEISFLSWGGGEAGFFAPFRHDCAGELKTVYCRAAILAAEALRAADPAATIATSEPLIHVVAAEAGASAQAAALRFGQHEAALTLLGKLRPDLGGSPELFDLIGLNYYPHNQFDSRRRMLAPDDARRRPLHRMLCDAQTIYGKPLLISETGAEGDSRAAWLEKVCAQVRLANARGADVRAACLYPILNHLGWDDERYCEHGLFCGLDESRSIYQPLADQIARETALGLSPERPELALAR